MKDSYCMQEAYQLALIAQKNQEIPVGAILVDKNGLLIGRGYNQVIQNCDPTAHAEINALRMAAKNCQNYRLNGATLYVTLEPCSMCAGALVQSRIERLVFATRDLKAGAAGTVCNLVSGYPFNHTIRVEEGIMQKESAALLQSFFKNRR